MNFVKDFDVTSDPKYFISCVKAFGHSVRRANQTGGGLDFSYTHYCRVKQSTQSLYKRWKRQV